MNRKVLNLYAGIGGNRKLWTDVEVTAVELNPEIAKIYQDFFPDDTVIVADAHQYLLDHYADGWDFIWSSPPCPTHSEMRLCRTKFGIIDAKFPDMKLYEEIIFMKTFSHCHYCIENVVSYYEPLIIPVEIGNHYFWANYVISSKDFDREPVEKITGCETVYGFSIKDIKIKHRKDQILRNLINPELGKHIFDMAFRCQQMTLFQVGETVDE